MTEGLLMDRARERLTEALELRARELRLRWNDVAARAGMSLSNLLRIRKGTVGLTALATDAIEDALEWERGSIDAVLAGGEPTPRSPAAPPPRGGGPDLSTIVERLERLEAQAATLKEEATAAEAQAAAVRQDLEEYRRATNTERSA